MWGGVERVYSNTEIEAINYLVDNKNYVSLNIDPQLIIKGVDEYVSSIDIIFGVPITQDICIEVFWGTEGKSFMADRMKTAIVKKGEQEIKIPLQEKVTDLRLDIGTNENISFVLESVTINKGMPRTLFSRIIQCMKENMKRRIWFDRFQILFLIFTYIFLHFVVDIRKMYEILFDKRWHIAGMVLLFVIVNKYHGDSIAVYDKYVQTGLGNDYVSPVLGEAREIRSDEWLVNTPINLSTQYLENPYGRYNDIVRGTDTINSNALTIISVLNPVSLVRTLINIVFGYEYAYSYGWYVNIFLTFLFQLELFLIISSRRKLLSTCGTCMVVLSSHYLWWGFPTIILYASAVLVCSYYFFNSESWKKRLIYAYGTALSAALFALVLYPAWEVPMAFYVLIVFVWIIHESWDNIKGMSKIDWDIFFSALLLFVIMIAENMLSQREYIEAITNTVYPGSRVEYGGFAITKLFNYIGAVLFPYIPYTNPSDAGMYITLFPLPLFVGLYTWIKGGKKDWLLNGLLVISILFGVYATVGIPPVVAKLTLMIYSTSDRCSEILGYIQVVLFVTALSRCDRTDKLNKKCALIWAIVASGFAVVVANWVMPNYMSSGYLIICFEVLLFIFFSCIAKVKKEIYELGLMVVILIAIVNGIYIRPICKGTDAIYSKPLADAILEIVSENRRAKWIAYNSQMIPGFAIACGAPTINSVNKYPNMDLWKKLDPNGSNNYFYNRYAHIVITFTEEVTNMELLNADLVRLNLGFQDIRKTEAEYILSSQPLDINNEYVEFDEIYNEAGSYIYKIIYY